MLRTWYKARLYYQAYCMSIQWLRDLAQLRPLRLTSRENYIYSIWPIQTQYSRVWYHFLDMVRSVQILDLTIKTTSFEQVLWVLFWAVFRTAFVRERLNVLSALELSFSPRILPNRSLTHVLRHLVVQLYHTLGLPVRA